MLTNFINIFAITHKKSDKGQMNKSVTPNTLKKLLEKLTV